jgi:hypothetical protein
MANFLRLFIMNTSFAILIDAGFAKRKIKSQTGRPVQAYDFASLVGSIQSNAYLAGKTLYRVFYYDAPPADGKLNNPLDGSTFDLSASNVARNSKQLLEGLKSLPFFALRMGQASTNGDSWKIKRQSSLNPVPGANSATLNPGDIVPNITQKGVDMRIGLDMATLALKKQVGIIVLVTADSDFVPAVKLARTEGVQIFLAHMGHTIKPELKEHADVLLDGISV